MNLFFVITVLSFVIDSSFADQAIPDFLHICKKNDPALQECFKESVLTLKPYLAKGVPEHKIPKLEPLLLKELLVAEPAGSTQTVSISVNNIKVYGCTDFDIKSINIDFDNDRADFELLFKQIYIDGTYAISGAIILLPVRGNGQIVGNFSNCIGDCKIETEKVKKPDGKEYLHVKTMDLKLQVQGGKVHLYNLFGGAGPLGDVINSVINQNFEAFSKELFPALERELSKLFLPMVNSIVSQYSYDVLFPAS